MQQLPDGTRIKNYTRNAIRFMDVTDGIVIDIAPESGGPIRCKTIHNKIPGRKFITEAEFSTGVLPDPEPDTYLVVALVVKNANPTRGDLVVPNLILNRDYQEGVVVCRGFSV